MTVGDRIYEQILRQPGITARALSEILGKRPEHIYGECGALENTRRITVDRSSQPCRYYARGVDAAPDPAESPWVSEFGDIIRRVTAALGREIDAGFTVVDRGLPHAPRTLPRGKMGVYAFLYGNEFLKIGKAGFHSGARFASQHYHPDSSNSNLARSILADDTMRDLGITRENVGDWIKQNTRRIDVLLDEALGIFALELIEAALHYTYAPRYEGFRSQR